MKQVTLIPVPKTSNAIFSPDRRYRYVLTRIWDKTKKMCCFIGLNPSTADEIVDDNTVRRCIEYAKNWGFGMLNILNIFAIRGSNPIIIEQVDDPVGIDNDRWIAETCKASDLVIAAWGNHGIYKDRCVKIINLVPNFHYLRLTKIGQPSHPLYLKKSLVPIPLTNDMARLITSVNYKKRW